VLLRLFQTARRFNVEIQPQLVLLQKTLLNIEGLGRQLDPELDLWKTAKPFLERWMNEQLGLLALETTSSARRRTGRACCRSCRAWCTRRSSATAEPPPRDPKLARLPAEGAAADALGALARRRADFAILVTRMLGVAIYPRAPDPLTDFSIANTPCCSGSSSST
jgi:hypothetical protein